MTILKSFTQPIDYSSKCAFSGRFCTTAAEMRIRRYTTHHPNHTLIDLHTWKLHQYISIYQAVGKYMDDLVEKVRILCKGCATHKNT